MKVAEFTKSRLGDSIKGIEGGDYDEAFIVGYTDAGAVIIGWTGTGGLFDYPSDRTNDEHIVLTGITSYEMLPYSNFGSGTWKPQRSAYDPTIRKPKAFGYGLDTTGCKINGATITGDTTEIRVKNTHTFDGVNVAVMSSEIKTEKTEEVVKEEIKVEKKLKVNTDVKGIAKDLASKNKDNALELAQVQSGKLGLGLARDFGKKHTKGAFKALLEGDKSGAIVDFIFANGVAALVGVFGQEDKRIEYITDGMLKRATFEVGDAVDVKAFMEKLLSKFDFDKIPGFGKKTEEV